MNLKVVPEDAVVEDAVAASEEDRIVRDPAIYLIGQSGLNSDAVAMFLESHETFWATDTDNGAELISEFAGRTCYMAFGDKQGRTSNQDYLENIIRMGHGSVLEHVVWTFIIEGVSRTFSHELVRHRAGVAFSQLSQRYVDESDTRFVMPPLIQEVEQADRWGGVISMWQDAMVRSLEQYQWLSTELALYIEERYPDLPRRMRRKMAREAARSVLPNATETIMVFSANARALRHVIEYRASPHAEPEIRQVANELWEIMRVAAPNLFGDYTQDEGVLGDVISTVNPKV